MDGWLDCHTEKVKTMNKLGQLVIPDILHRDLILSFMHIIFNLRDIKVVICIILNIEVGIVGDDTFLRTHMRNVYATSTRTRCRNKSAKNLTRTSANAQPHY